MVHSIVHVSTAGWSYKIHAALVPQSGVISRINFTTFRALYTVDLYTVDTINGRNSFIGSVTVTRMRRDSLVEKLAGYLGGEPDHHMKRRLDELHRRLQH
jgi:hypothetical protein